MRRVQKWQRDPDGIRLRILEAARGEFAAHGLAILFLFHAVDFARFFVENVLKIWLLKTGPDFNALALCFAQTDAGPPAILSNEFNARLFERDA
jgi:hypothetical protein